MHDNGKKHGAEAAAETGEKVSKLVEEVTAKGKALLDEGLQNVKEIVQEKAQAIKEKAKDLDVDEMAQEVRSFVRRRPLASLGMAFGVGFLISSLFRSRN